MKNHAFVLKIKILTQDFMTSKIEIEDKFGRSLKYGDFLKQNIEDLVDHPQPLHDIKIFSDAPIKKIEYKLIMKMWIEIQNGTGI